MPRVYSRTPVEGRFWAKVSPEPNSGCWLWDGGWWKGYGTIDRRLATHVALEMHGRPRPKGMQACHTCDVPACVNPDHLYWGTGRNNRADMFMRGRDNLPLGSNHGNAKLTEDDVRLIRASDQLHRLLATQFGVSRQVIGRVKSRDIWKHVP